jgi:hypothetical protein
MTRPPGHTGQTAMHPTISYYLTQARAAGLGRHAQRIGRRPQAGARPRVLRRTRAVPGSAQAGQPAVAGDASAR